MPLAGQAPVPRGRLAQRPPPARALPFAVRSCIPVSPRAPLLSSRGLERPVAPPKTYSCGSPELARCRQSRKRCAGGASQRRPEKLGTGGFLASFLACFSWWIVLPPSGGDARGELLSWRRGACSLGLDSGWNAQEWSVRAGCRGITSRQGRGRITWVLVGDPAKLADPALGKHPFRNTAF